MSKQFKGRTAGQPSPLAFRPRKKKAVHRLPFVGDEHTGDGSFSWWNLPATGGYRGGWKTGEAVATMYLKHLRNGGDDSSLFLGWMVDHWMQRMDCAPEGPESPDLVPLSGQLIGTFDSPERSALRGQMMGFMFGLNKCLKAGASFLNSNLDHISNDFLLAEANAGAGINGGDAVCDVKWGA